VSAASAQPVAPPVEPIAIGIVGLGKIACDQHLPRIAANPAFALAATASPQAGGSGAPHFATLAQMLQAQPALAAVVICTPPQSHYDIAAEALAAGKHVLLEKPPCVSVEQLDQLQQRARTAGRTLFTAWHSQYAAAVPLAEGALRSRALRAVRVTWLEDVRHWHPGQSWLTQPGGFGVFDAGINAISILTRLIPGALSVCSSRLFVPANWSTPIAAEFALQSERGVRITGELDFAHPGAPRWEIELVCETGTLRLADGGSRLMLDGEPLPEPAAALADEYAAIYDRFAELIAHGESQVDARPLQCVCELLRVASAVTVGAFSH